MIGHILRRIAMKRELDRKLAIRKRARPARQEAASRGQSTYWQRAGERTRELFG